MRRAVGALAVVIFGAVVVLAAAVLRMPTDVATPSPSPTASASPSPTATTALTASPSATPTPQALYTSKKLGFALELRPPWHKAACGNVDPVADGLPAYPGPVEHFTNAGPMDEFIGHVGSPNDRIVVALEEDPQRRSMLEIARATFSGAPSSVKDVSFGGRPAVEGSQVTPGGEQLFYFVTAGDRFYRVGYQTFRPASAPPADVTTMRGILGAFRLLSDAERQALPDPTPIPAAAPTAQALAAMLKAAFEAKDLAVLERLLGPCLNPGGESAGASQLTRQRYISELRAQFAAGLVVTVDTDRIRTEEGYRDTSVRSRWNAIPAGELTPPPSPGARSYDVDLFFGRTAGGFYWRGTTVLLTPP